ncbi:MAG: hypothetical protein ACI8T1_001889 [Verrucomicrobiales bacterium]|jgi:hypothetical protein
MIRVALLGLCAMIGFVRAEDVSYSKDIRPILSKNCFACHGPDEEARKAKTRLDIPGEADLEEVLSRIVSHEADDVMPPPEANKTLSPSEIDLIKRWIAVGAQYEQHWAFVLPKKANVPPETHPVDHFIDRRLTESELTRSPKADAYTRIRRVSLDLVGLLPSPEEADAFAADPSDEAYQTIADKLLASKRYGERWARRWLDLARYADTNGYEKDRDRSIWPYRDWVIRAMNADMPFDQFTIDQLAGDMLPYPRPDQLVATGFHRNTMLNEEGGIDPLEFRYHAMTDRVATTGTTWLGLTTGCAQCHTHKYDPITHHDYFGMMAYLNNAAEPDYFLPAKDAESRHAINLTKAAKLAEALPTHWPKENASSSESAFDTWLKKQQQENLIDWQTLIPKTMSANYPYLTQESEGIIFSAGDTSKHDIYTLEFPPQDHAISAIRLEALPDERLPSNGPGMTDYEGPKGDFFLSEFKLEDANGTMLEITEASETYAKNAFGNNPASAKLATDGDFQSGWSVKEGQGRAHTAVFNLTQPIAAGSAFTLNMHFGRHYASSMGKFRLSTAASDKTFIATMPWPPANGALTKDNPLVTEAFLFQAPMLAAQVAEIRKLRQPVTGPLTLIMRERPSDHPRPTHLHHRGEFTQPKERVHPRLPSAIWPEEKAPPANRLEFARWLVSAENPLTARVVVNRQWAAFFGIGLVKTLDDFGMQGELPSHPQLLDHLAVTFMENDWSMKALHRLIVTSQTYQQSSDIADRDSVRIHDRLLPRFSRFRLEAEIIRDASLGASGLLDTKMFGKPVRPVQPEEAAANYSKSQWKASKGSDRHRRSVYTYQKRTAPFAMFTTFDATSGEACVAKRDVSNTPLQALTLMNDPMFLEIATAYGERIAATEGNVRKKIITGFRWLLTRPPSADEIAALSDFHAKHQNWTALARVILGLDESISKN